MNLTNVLDPAVRRCFTRMVYEAATPFAYKMLRHLKNGNWRGLCASAPDPREYTHAPTYQADALIGNFFKKYKDWDLGEDLVAKAIKSFHECEAMCYAANERLSPHVHRDVKLHDGGVRDYINLVRKNVKQVLGRIPNNLSGKFGPGSTYGDTGSLATLPDKMNSYPTMTTGASVLNSLWEQTAWARYGCNRLNTVPGYARVSPETVRGNRWISVDKDALKRRGICIEPSVNLYWQLGVGGVIRQKLKETGIDIVNAQRLHRYLAFRASLDGSLATLDLSNASDTICRNLVKLLLPSEWFTLLDSLRSPFTFVNGKWVKLEKFSSMGNGYTFELETLLFLCIARATHEYKSTFDSTPLGDFDVATFTRGEYVESGPNVIAVYGDDIIVPTAIAEDVINALNFFGLTTNKDKTFITGPFRESCGGDYFQGLDTRAHYLKENPCEPQQFISLANGLRRCGKNAWGFDGSNVPYHRAWLSCLDALPSVIRACTGPESLGDIVIHQEPSQWRSNPTRKQRGGIYYLRAYKPLKPKRLSWDYWHPGVVLASALYGSGDGSVSEIGSERKFIDRGGVFPRQDTLLSYKVGWVAQS